MSYHKIPRDQHMKNLLIVCVVGAAGSILLCAGIGALIYSGSKGADGRQVAPRVAHDHAEKTSERPRPATVAPAVAPAVPAPKPPSPPFAPADKWRELGN